MSVAPRPLFIPLKTEWFRAFESGAKQVEYRLYGPRWNERTVYPGRRATLSLGYSGDRLDAVVIAHQLVKARDVPRATELYPADATLIAIRLRLIDRR